MGASWAANTKLPVNASFYMLHRRSDVSYGVDLRMNGSEATGNPDVHKFAALWTAHIACPAKASIHKAHRGGDPGFGVDLTINGSKLDADVWDDDGDAYFMLSQGNASCKVSVGSNGLGPGLEVEVFQQRGLMCNVVNSTGGPTVYALVLST